MRNEKLEMRNCGVRCRTRTYIKVLPLSVSALRGVVFYTAAEINQDLSAVRQALF